MTSNSMVSLLMASESQYGAEWSLNQQQVSALYSESGGRMLLMDRFLEHIAQRNWADANSQGFSRTRQLVENKVDAILGQVKGPLVAELGGHFVLEREPMGSASENTKITGPNEFDYLIFLTPTKPRVFDLHSTQYRSTKHEFTPKSYCDVMINETQGWASHLLTGNNLLPGKVYNLFFDLVTQATDKGSKVTQKGPSVTLYLQLKGIVGFIKVDMCLALVIDKDMIDGCLRQVESRIKLPSEVASCDIFHVICSGNYWKLSVCRAENMYMNRLDPAAKNLYKVLKVLTDDVAVTHNLEDPCMGSYPLKVALIHHLEDLKAQGRAGSLHTDAIYFNALRVLRLVDQTLDTKGTPSLCSFIMEDDPIFKESERSYLEARRVMIYIRRIIDIFSLYGLVHTVYLIVLLIMGTFSSRFVLNNKFTWNDYSRNNHQVVMTSIKLLICIGMLGSPLQEWIMREKLMAGPRRTKRKIFIGNWTLLLYYVVFLVVYIVELVCWVKLVHYSVDAESRLSMYYTVRTTEIMVPAVIFVHFALTLFLTRGQIWKHRWEWVYFDLLIKDKIRWPLKK